MESYYLLVVFAIVCFSTTKVLSCREEVILSCGQEGCLCQDGIPIHQTCSTYKDLCETGRHCDTEMGECVCSTCWRGDNCEIVDNPNPPIFEQPVYQWHVSTETQDSFSVRAVDKDSETCADDSSPACPCGRVLYSLQSKNSGRFSIDPHSGVIEYTGTGDTQVAHTLIVNARNQYPGMYERLAETQATVEIIIHKTDDENSDLKFKSDSRVNHVLSRKQRDLESHHHHISKRSATPENVTFCLEKTGDSVSKTEVKVGEVLHFKMTGWIPIESTSLYCEIISEYDSMGGPLMSLCPPNITHVGGNLFTKDNEKLNASSISVEMDSFNGEYIYDRAVINFNTVENDKSSSVEGDIQIMVEFKVVMQNPCNSSHVYWVSTGCAYFDKYKVWVGQSSFTCVEDTLESAHAPTFSLLGPSQVTPEVFYLFTLAITMKDAVNKIALDVYAPVNDSNVMSICRVSLSGMGSGFTCYDDKRVKSTLIADEVNGNLTSIYSLELGEIINSAYWYLSPGDEDSTINVEIVIVVPNEGNAQDGNKYPLGVAVQLDSNITWTGLKELEVVNDPVSNCGNFKASDFTLTTSIDKIPDASQTMLELNMTLSSNSTGSYKVEFGMPFNNSGMMHICHTRVRHIGFNYGCLKTPLPVYESTDNSSVMDFVTLDFGIITNTGQRIDADSNTIVVEIIAAPVTDPGSEMYIVAGVSCGNDQIWVGCNPINIIAHDWNTPPKEPSVEMHNVMGPAHDTVLYSKGQSVIWVDFKPPLGAFYPEIEFSFSSALNNASDPEEPATYFCSISFIHIGSHFPCLDIPDVVFDDTRKPGYPDVGKVSLSNVTNIGRFDYPSWHNDSVIRAQLVIGIVDDEKMVNGSNYYTSISIKYWNDTIWVGKLCRTYDAGYPVLSKEDTDPIVELEMKSLNNTLMTNQIIQYSLNIYPAPRTATNYKITTLIAENKTLSICRVAIKKQGKNIPCIYSGSETIYKDNFNQSVYDRAYLDLFTIVNIGEEAYSESNKGDNLLQVDVTAQFHPSFVDTTSYSESLHVNPVVEVGTDEIYVTTGTVEVSTGTLPTFTSLNLTPTFFMGVRTSHKKLPIGGAVVLTINLHIPPGTAGSYFVEIFAPVNSSLIGQFHLCDIRIITAGWNLPCVNDQLVSRSLETVVDANDTVSWATLDVGIVANQRETGPIEEPDNLLVLEGIGLLRPNESIMVGDSVCLGSSVKMNDELLWVGSLCLDVPDDVVYDQSPVSVAIAIAESSCGSTQTVGGRCMWTLIITMEGLMTANVTITITTPDAVGGETFLVIYNAEYSENATGVNFPCVSKMQLDPQYLSTVSTTQTDLSHIYLGPITNTGTSDRYQFGKKTINDDNIAVSFEFQVQDHIGNNHAAMLPFAAEVTAFDGTNTVSAQANASIAVERDGNEAPLLAARVWLPVTPTDPKSLRPGSSIACSVNLKHENISSTTAYEVSVKLTKPTEVSLHNVTDWGITTVETSHSVQENVLLFTYSKILFPDDVTLELLLDIDKNETLATGTGLVHVSLWFAVEYKKADRGAGNYPATITGSYTTSPTNVEFDFYVPDCVDMISETNGMLKSCQKTWQPRGAVLTTELSSSLPYSDPYPQNQYLQWYFGNMTRVTGVTFTSRINVTTNFTINMTVSYSTNDKIWTDYNVGNTQEIKIFEVEMDITVMEQDNVFYPFTDAGVVARYFRIRLFVDDATEHKVNLTDYDIDVNGCFKSSDKYPDDIVCPSQSKDVYDRGYLLNENQGILYVCMLSSSTSYVQCAYTRDSGTSWTVMDENLLNIHFLDKDTNKIYGISRKHMSYMRSDDHGDTWCLITDTEYDAVKQEISRLMEVVKLPFEDFTAHELAINGTNKWKVDTNYIYLWSNSNWMQVGFFSFKE